VFERGRRAPARFPDSDGEDHRGSGRGPACLTMGRKHEPRETAAQPRLLNKQQERPLFFGFWRWTRREIGKAMGAGCANKRWSGNFRSCIGNDFFQRQPMIRRPVYLPCFFWQRNAA